jgi:hypothetical protein
LFLASLWTYKWFVCVCVCVCVWLPDILQTC